MTHLHKCIVDDSDSKCDQIKSQISGTIEFLRCLQAETGIFVFCAVVRNICLFVSLFFLLQNIVEIV